MAQERPLVNHIEVCSKEFDLRYINSGTKFGEKNPPENGKFLSVIFLCYLLRNKFFKNGICVLSCFSNKKSIQTNAYIPSTFLPEKTHMNRETNLKYFLSSKCDGAVLEIYLDHKF